MPAGPGLFLAMASEGGHASFPFQSPEEYEFHEFLKRRLGQPYAWGDVVLSGSGLVALHAFLTGQEWSAQAVSADAPQTSETHRWFSRLYGRACRNLALETYATGGVYVTGGVAAKNPHFVTSDAFREEFHLSPTYADLLARIAAQTQEELLSVIQRVHRIDGVKHSETMLAMATPVEYRSLPLVQHVTQRRTK